MKNLFNYRLLLLAFTLFVFANCKNAPSISSGNSTATKAVETIGDFVKRYPNEYSAREKPIFDKFMADAKAINERGEIDLQALVSGKLPPNTVGIGPVLAVKEDMIRYVNNKYDPDNGVLNVAVYAKKLGLANITAYPTFAANDDVFMIHMPGESRDGMLVSDLNHNITFYKSIYPGDKLYYVHNKRTILDNTPKEGSQYRSMAFQYEGSIYNQKAEKVNDVIFRVTESYTTYKEGVTPPPSTGPTPPGWIAPKWDSRPNHVYTDKDYDTLKDLWSKEKRQGATPLFYEDVKIGDQPTTTVDGPITASVMPQEPFGNGLGGSRTLRKEILTPSVFKTMTKNALGIYQMPNAADNVPVVPKFERLAGAGGPPPPPPPPSGTNDIKTADLHKMQDNTRSVLINFLGRDLAIRHLNNWMGDAGWLKNIRWGIMEPAAMEAVGLKVPTSPFSERYLHRVPFMKDKHMNAHGLTNDVAIVNSYVYDKHVVNGENLVELVWWIETIDGYLFEEGGATIKLPSK
ncbi:MAG: hypothetical protein U5L45_19880 [Saprospiraceae bacterium]|nr:hypothetical protein [Saprospiraceae bacterium]